MINIESNKAAADRLEISRAGTHEAFQVCHAAASEYGTVYDAQAQIAQVFVFGFLRA